MKQYRIDVCIEGQGFYSITGESKRGRSWINRNVQGSASGAACSDDTGMTQDIAEGATAAGLQVIVNGYMYIAGGTRGEKVAA